MPRFFTEQIGGGRASLSGEDARHVFCALRMKPGDALTLCDGRGADYACRIAAASADRVELEVLSCAPCAAEPPAPVSLYLALPKGDKLDFGVQKAVELGAARIVPVLTSRCVSRPDARAMASRLERLRHIAREAAGQAGRGIVPEVAPLLPFSAAVREMAENGTGLFFYENGGMRVGEALLPRPRRVSLIVGPEGGFSPEEAGEARDAGLRVCTLGPRILRCETAPLAALAIVQYILEES